MPLHNSSFAHRVHLAFTIRNCIMILNHRRQKVSVWPGSSLTLTLIFISLSLTHRLTASFQRLLSLSRYISVARTTQDPTPLLRRAFPLAFTPATAYLPSLIAPATTPPTITTRPTSYVSACCTRFSVLCTPATIPRTCAYVSNSLPIKPRRQANASKMAPPRNTKRAKGELGGDEVSTQTLSSSRGTQILHPPRFVSCFEFNPPHLLCPSPLFLTLHSHH